MAAYRLASEREFEHKGHGVAYALERFRELDKHGLSLIHAITEGKRMEHLLVKATTIANDVGWFSALASTYTTDRTGERVKPGAFAKTIEWQASGKKIPLHWDHKGGDPSYIVGSIDPRAMAELDEGLYVEGMLDLDGSEIAREAWRSMKANRLGLSFGYLVTKSQKASDGVLDLTEIDVFEITITPSPVQGDTRILSTKSVRPSVEELKARSRALGIDVPESGSKSVKPSRKAAPAIQIASFEC